jgi:hypothetical protein
MSADPNFPYLSIPAEARWRDAVASREVRSIDPHLGGGLRVSPGDRLASAGSCFAQRISDALQSSGYNYLMLEEGPRFLAVNDRRASGYGLYTARYGNVYTALQLVQLFHRAFGRFDPKEPVWQRADRSYVDPFRPAIQPSGFVSEAECLWDRQAHLAAVRRMFEEVDVFIFTLGLTESWGSNVDGAIFPNCPGSILGGAFDPARHVFHNFTVAEVTAHLDAFATELRAVNRKAEIILTVSPVPLLATFEARHVLQSTVYSKSVLRVACEETIRRHSHVQYFASYEIVTASGDSRAYFLEDRRTVSDMAVKHVVDCFFRHYTGSAANQRAPAGNAAPAFPGTSASQPICDEDLVMAALADQAR